MTDPTAIKIDFNPTVQRIKGVTLHGSAAFDVPLISEIAPNLWQGGCEDGLILPDFIKHLVSLYPWESYTVRHELDSALLVRMYDSADQTFEQIEQLARWVNLCRTTGPVLVHCQAGLNRSSLVAARALILEGMSADDAIMTVRTKRSPACLCNGELRGLPAHIRLWPTHQQQCRGACLTAQDSHDKGPPKNIGCDPSATTCGHNVRDGLTEPPLQLGHLVPSWVGAGRTAAERVITMA